MSLNSADAVDTANLTATMTTSEPARGTTALPESVSVGSPSVPVSNLILGSNPSVVTQATPIQVQTTSPAVQTSLPFMPAAATPSAGENSLSALPTHEVVPTISSGQTSIPVQSGGSSPAESHSQTSQVNSAIPYSSASSPSSLPTVPVSTSPSSSTSQLMTSASSPHFNTPHSTDETATSTTSTYQFTPARQP